MNKDKIREMSTVIRIIAFNCESKDVFSSQFGNEFGDKVEKYLAEVLGEED